MVGANRGGAGLDCTLAKHQLPKRVTLPFLVQTLDAFHQGKLDTETARQLLNVSRAHLFRLRALWLQPPTTFALQLSGGNHHPAWPEEVRQFLKAFLPLQRPPNYQLVADELAGRFGLSATVNRLRPTPVLTFRFWSTHRPRP